jgi:hypothetical protein
MIEAGLSFAAFQATAKDRLFCEGKKQTCLNLVCICRHSEFVPVSTFSNCFRKQFEKEEAGTDKEATLLPRRLKATD